MNLTEKDYKDRLLGNLDALSQMHGISPSVKDIIMENVEGYRTEALKNMESSSRIIESRPLDEIRNKLTPVNVIIDIIQNDIELFKMKDETRDLILQEILKSKANIKDLCDSR